MAKRPTVDLMALTAEQATPMPEAIQRTPPLQATAPDTGGRTASLEALAFKVPPDFRRRFKQRAVTADLKLNELLFAALDAWEEKQGFR